MPSERRVVLIPPVVKCVACGCSSLTTIKAASCHSQPIVYSTRGTLQAELWGKKCNGCGARHNMSFASNVKKLPKGTEQFYSEKAVVGPEGVEGWLISWLACALNSLLRFALVTLVASYHTRTSLAQELGNLFARRSAPRRHRADATPGRDEAAALHRPPARDVEALLVRLAID